MMYSDFIIIVILLYMVVQLVRIEDTLKEIKKSLRKKREIHLKFFKVENGIIINREVTMLGMTKTQKCQIAVKAFDSSEPPQEAPVENITFQSTDDTVCTVVQDPTDPTKAEVTGVGDGVAQILVSGDADLGEGETTIEGTLSVEIQSVTATNFTITPGVPVEQ